METFPLAVFLKTIFLWVNVLKTTNYIEVCGCKRTKYEKIQVVCICKYYRITSAGFSLHFIINYLFGSIIFVQQAILFCIVCFAASHFLHCKFSFKDYVTIKYSDVIWFFVLNDNKILSIDCSCCWCTFSFHLTFYKYAWKLASEEPGSFVN